MPPTSLSSPTYHPSSGSQLKAELLSYWDLKALVEYVLDSESKALDDAFTLICMVHILNTNNQVCHILIIQTCICPLGIDLFSANGLRKL